MIGAWFVAPFPFLLQSIASLAAGVAQAGAPETRDAARVDAVYTAGERAAWVIEQAGKRIGSHFFDYAGSEALGDVTAHRFDGGLEMETPTALGVARIRASGSLWTDEHGHPLKFASHGEALGVKSALDFVVAGDKAHAKLQQGPAARTLDAAIAANVFLLANNWVGMIELVARLRAPAAGASAKIALFSADVFQALTYELTHAGDFAARRGDELVEGAKFRDSLGEVLMVEPGGRLFALEVPPQAVKFRRVDESGEVAAADRVARFALDVVLPLPGDFLREEVSIRHGDGAVVLSGTVSRKKGSPARSPAVFFISGSGPQDREGLAGGIDVGTHELLDHLTEAGFLVLRVDDRGVGRSVGPIAGASYDDLIADARACVDHLLVRADVDPAKIFLIGHSEGGETAPILACERRVAGIVLMAAPGRSMFEILREQKLDALQRAGVPEAQIAAELAVHKQFLELVASEDEIDGTQVREDYRPFLAQRPWFQSHARRDPLAQIRAVKCPILIVQGDMDLQVSAERDAPPLEAAAKEGGNTDVTLRRFARLDHLFKKIEAEKPTLSDYLMPRPVDREFQDFVAAWLKERAAR